MVLQLLQKEMGVGTAGGSPVGHPEGGMSQLYIYGKCVPACTDSLQWIT